MKTIRWIEDNTLDPFLSGFDHRRRDILRTGTVVKLRERDAQLACDQRQRPTAARQQGNRLPFELIRKLMTALAHSTPFRSPRSLAKVSTNSGEAQFFLASSSRPREGS